MKEVKDVPLGVLIIVLSQFVLYGALYLAKFPSVFEFMGIVFCILFSSDMANFGVRLMRGYKHDPNES